MLYTKRKKYSGRWVIKLMEAALIFGVIFFGLDLLGQIFAPTVTETVIVVREDRVVEEYTNQNINPQLDASNYFDLALDHQISGDYYDAIADYSNSIELNPEIYSSWLNRGVAYEQLGRDNHAMYDFNQFLTRDTLVISELDAIKDSTTLGATMTFNHRFDVPMDLANGDVVNINVVSLQEDVVDPIIVLVNADGEAVAANDDALRTDGSLISMNSYINNYDVTATEEYTLMISHAGGGSEGAFVIRVDIDN